MWYLLIHVLSFIFNFCLCFYDRLKYFSEYKFTELYIFSSKCLRSFSAVFWILRLCPWNMIVTVLRVFFLNSLFLILRFFFIFYLVIDSENLFCIGVPCCMVSLLPSRPFLCIWEPHWSCPAHTLLFSWRFFLTVSKNFHFVFLF